MKRILLAITLLSVPAVGFGWCMNAFSFERALEPVCGALPVFSGTEIAAARDGVAAHPVVSVDAAGFSVSEKAALSSAADRKPSAAAPQTPAGAERAGEILEKLAAGFRALGAYGVTFEVAADDKAVQGRYAVEGDRYYIVLGDAEVYSDGAVRYEIDNRRREVTLDAVDTTSRNILANPARAFDFIGSEYAASLLSEQGGRALVRLVPTSKEVSPAGEVIVTVDTAAMRPISLRYDYDGERVDISVLSVAPLDAPLKAFDRANYAGYEFIDFR